MKFTVAFLLVLITTFSFAQIPSYVPSSGLIGWWPFNGNANDESGNGNNGTVSGAVLSVDRNGNPNSAYAFVNNIITISNSFFNNGWTNYSISIWALTSDINISAQNIYNTYPHDGEGFGYNHPNAPSKYSFWKNSNINVHAWDIFSANPWNYNNIQSNQWYHLMIVKENLNYKFYVNGLLDKTSIATNTPLNQTCGLNFGSIGSSEFFNGTLDDIAIWDRALTDTEITTLYNGCNLVISSQPNNQNVNLSAGTVNFSVGSSITSAIYQWQTNLGLGFQNISNAGQYSGAQMPTLTLSNISISNNNQQFRCIVSEGGCSDTTDIAQLTIIDDAEIPENLEAKFQIFPNPVEDKLILHGLTIEDNQYEVVSVEGKVIQHGLTSGEIQTDNLNRGRYFLRINNQEIPFVKN